MKSLLTCIMQCIVILLIYVSKKGLTCMTSRQFISTENVPKFKTHRTFKAAVYEHAVKIPWNVLTPVSRAKALENMMKNLYIYQQQVEIAGREEVDIIVFPEDGIYGMIMTRIALMPYLEYIPDPKVEQWNPCAEPERHPNSEVQGFLSCLARNNSIYVVANFGDIQPCDNASDPLCPSDGHFQYNTDLVYDKNGTLIAKYYKENLFYESQFDKPKSVEFVYFDTSFGRFGVFTCFDILFYEPAIALIEKYNVTNIAFPTAWMDALPLLSAIQFHSAFAAGVGVNFLSANIHYPKDRFHGSGIYTPSGAVSYYYNDTSKDGKLLINELNMIQQKGKHKNIESHMTKIVKYTLLQPYYDKLNFHTPKQEHTFNSYVFHDLFTFVALSSGTRMLSVCQESFCCYLEYDYAEPNRSDYFAFGAFSGLHTYQGKYYLQVCALLKCASDNPKSCGSAAKGAFTKFNLIDIQGNFSTEFVYPEILLTKDGTKLSLAAVGDWKYENKSLTFYSDEYPVLSAALFGRLYDKDPPESHPGK